MANFESGLTNAKEWAARLSKHATKYNQQMLLDSWLLGATYKPDSKLCRDYFEALYSNRDNFVSLGFRSGLKSKDYAPELDDTLKQQAMEELKDICSGCRYEAILMKELEKIKQLSFGF